MPDLDHLFEGDDPLMELARIVSGTYPGMQLRKRPIPAPPLHDVGMQEMESALVEHLRHTAPRS